MSWGLIFKPCGGDIKDFAGDVIFYWFPKNKYDKGGQTFVLTVDAFDGDPEANYNEGVNPGKTRVGIATWVPITDKKGIPLTASNPFKNGPTDDPCTNPDTCGGRAAADEVNGTPYGRPEDIEVGNPSNGHEVSISLTATLNSPDNLAQDAVGNIFVIEDAPNSSATGGDVWFARDVNGDGVAESLDHFMSNRVDDSEATGMIFDPAKPTRFVAAIQHPDSTDIPGATGDALWSFDLGNVEPPAACNDAQVMSENSGCNYVRLLGAAQLP